MTWFQDWGYEKNPLSMKPTDTSLVGYEKLINRIIYQIKIGNVIFLEGSFGTGKSSILRHVRKHFKDNIVYMNYARKKNLKKRIMDSRNSFQKMLGMKPKELFVLIDEVNLGDSRDFDFLYEFYIMDRVKSIIFAGTSFKDAPFNKAFKSDTKLYKMNELHKTLGSTIVTDRMPEQKHISSALANQVFEKSHKNPRQFLENVEDIFRNVHIKGNKRVSKKDVEEFFEK